MKAKKLALVTVPIMLLFGCGIENKVSEPKTEEVDKVEVSEEKYPYYICELIIEFQNKQEEYTNTVTRAFKGGGDLQDVLASVDGLEDVLNDMENIKPPKKYENQQKVTQEGVDESRKGLELIRDGMKLIADGSAEDRQKGKETVMEGIDTVMYADKNMWHSVVKDLYAENPKVYEQALLNKAY